MQPKFHKAKRDSEAARSDEQPDSEHAHSASREYVLALLLQLLSKDLPAEHTLQKRQKCPYQRD